MKKCFFAVLICFHAVSSHSLPYTDPSNEFRPGAFPAEVDNVVFSIPVSPDGLAVVYPAAADSILPDMKARLGEKLGADIPFLNAADTSARELATRHCVVIGNISDNPFMLELYRRRFAFADAYFPGEGGVVIHPARSLWNPEKRCIVIGVSRDEDIADAFTAFTGLLESGAKNIGPLHYLDTALAFPDAPESVAPTLDTAFENATTAMAPYWTIANWGLLYFLSGDTAWAKHFRDGMRMCYKRAEQQGRWVSESWTNLYFNHWKLVYAWELIGDDPVFTPEDRRIIEETLWGFTSFCRWLPNLDAENAPLFEPRQNHTTFLALSLYYSHRYYTEKYHNDGLDPMMEKVRRCFDHGQAHCYRPNDDAGNYLYLAPLHMLTYDLAEGRDGFFTSGRFRTLADLVVATIDNRRDPVSFGDVGGYSHRGPGATRGRELQFLGLGAWRYGDPVYQWLYNWGARDRVISLDTMREKDSGEENPIRMHFGADRVFSVEDMYTGVYAVNMEEEEPERYLGVFPVILDDSALRWSAKRAEKASWLPRKNERYFDKLSYRWNFNPNSEYMLLDGLSAMSHGHLDGNTVSRLTWQDRIWLFDLDYIKLTPRYHNGIIIGRDGVQEDPPPLTVLDCAVDFSKFGFTRTTLRDYNGADWERNIVWRKGRYFFFIDTITARNTGDFRLESLWRTRGDVSLDGNILTARQGDAVFFIKSADDSFKKLDIQPDGTRSRWNYPYGNGDITVLSGNKRIPLSAGERYLYSSLMYAVDEEEEMPRELKRLDSNLFAVGNPETSDLIGLDPAFLEEENVFSDCDLFIKDSRSIWLMNATYIRFGNAFLEAPGKVHIEINFRDGKGRLTVPDNSTGRFKVRNIAMQRRTVEDGGNPDRGGGESSAKNYEFEFTFKGVFWKNRIPFARLDLDAQPVGQDSPPAAEQPFAIERLDEHGSSDALTASASFGDILFTGDIQGGIHRFDARGFEKLCTLPSGKEVSCIHAADLDKDNSPEIIAADNDENLYCFDSAGSLRWSHKLTKYYGTDANAVSITSANIDNSGKPAVLVSTAGWKLYAINGDGSIRWESFTYYHPQTGIAVVENGGGTFIAVGTEYHTPLNVVSAADGRVLWHVWEEMGSEYISTTEYCGIHLTDMAVIPADGKQGAAVAFGTKSNRIYALDAADGSMRWQVGAGGEVTAMTSWRRAETNSSTILSGTDTGDLVALDRNGTVIKRVSFEQRITDIVLLDGGGDTVFIAVGSGDGTVRILDETLAVKGVFAAAGGGVKALHAAKAGGDGYTFFATTGQSVYRLGFTPLGLKKSRHY